MWQWHACVAWNRTVQLNWMHGHIREMLLMWLFILFYFIFLHCLSLSQYLNNSQCTIVIRSRKRSSLEIIIRRKKCMIFFLILPIYQFVLSCWMQPLTKKYLIISSFVFFCSILGIQIQPELQKCWDVLNLNKMKTKRISNHMSQYFIHNRT